MPRPRVLGRQTFRADVLQRTHPPVFTHPNKRAVWRLAVPKGATLDDVLRVRRVDALALPARVPATGHLRVRPTAFGYAAPPLGGAAWYLNFANEDAFRWYGGGLFAQDESQVAEHPALALLREALKKAKKGLTLRTRVGARPTPVLVEGVRRRAKVVGLYGWKFSAAKVKDVEKATRIVRPKYATNVLAVAAPEPQKGKYTRAQVNYILTAAYTAFAAAAAVTGAGRTDVHTGHWGTGAYGGDRELMALCQVVAARMAGVTLVFHGFNAAGTKPVRRAVALLETWTAGKPVATADLLDRIVAHGFAWGQSDGN